MGEKLTRIHDSVGARHVVPLVLTDRVFRNVSSNGCQFFFVSDDSFNIASLPNRFSLGIPLDVDSSGYL